MGEEIFSGFGIKISKQDEKFYIEYDAGELTVQPRLIEVTEEEAIKAQRSQQDAYEVLVMK